MPANNALLLSDINFDDIKTNLQTFLSNQTELGDYDYESSTMQVLLNLLAYNTYMNSYYLNMVGNEMFLDSAQIRSNVVSRAKMLGYTPRSDQGPTATIQVTVTPSDTPETITIEENTRFTSTIDGKQYIFVNPETLVINANSTGVYSGKLSVVEGRPFTFEYTVSSLNPSRYIIPADKADTRSLKVQVQESANNSNVTTYNLASNLTTVTGNSNVYFLQENEDGRYEILFGDNVLGNQLNDGNIVKLSYRTTNGNATQGANTFTSSASIGGYTNYTISTISVARGGGNKETIQSIKLNAPKNYQTQNRAVTVKDYETLVKSSFANIQTVSAWGGEENSPPVYGKVYVSIKPTDSLLLSDDEKENVVDFLKERNMVSVEPIIINPTYVYIKPTIDVKYNPDFTSDNVGDLGTKISNAIKNYELNQLGLFKKNYIGSNLIKEIDKVSESINSVQINLNIFKTFVPTTTAATTYTINFSRSLLNITGDTVLRGISPAAHPGKGLAVDSSSFTYNGVANSYFDDDGFGNVRIYYFDSSNVKVYTNRLAGTVDYNTGIIKLNNLLISAYSGDNVKIYVDPDTNDIDTVRNQILLISQARVNVYNEKLKRNTLTISEINTQGTTTNIVEDGIQSAVF